ncbi:MAG: hypothetical protein IKN53_01655, partial [Oscillibacter sp.]|nr:hypothetical protein [Oscillibacter sp.]
QTGSSTVTITGGEVKRAVAATYNASNTGAVTITISDAVVKDIYGGANNVTTHTGNSVLTLTDAVVTGNIYAGGNEARNTAGDVTLTVTGGSVAGEIVANFKSTSVGTVNLVNTSVAGTILLNNDRYTGGNAPGTATLNLDASTSLTLSNGAALTAASFVGGGELHLANGTTVTASSVTGTTALYVEGLTADTVYVTTPNTATSAFTDGDNTDDYIVKSEEVGETLRWSFEEYVAAPVLVYVSASGNDENDGASVGTAVATMAKAYELVASGMAAQGKESNPAASATIVVDGIVNLDANNADFGDEHVYTVIVTGNTPEDGFSLQVQYPYNVLGPTTFENITLRHDKDESPTTQPGIRGDGYALTIGEGVTTVGNTSTATTYYPNLFGGKITAGTYDSSVSVSSGTWDYVVGGTRGGTQTGSSTVTITGGEVKRAVTATYNAANSGAVTITISNARVKDVYGGANSVATHTGNNVIALTDTVVTGNIYAGGNTDRNTAGDVTLTVTGGSVAGEIVVNFKSTSVGALNLVNTSVGGTILLNNDRYTGGNAPGTATLNLDASSALTLTGANTLTAASFTGGGALNLGANTALTLPAFTGATALTVLPAPTADQTYVTVLGTASTTDFTDAVADNFDLTATPSGDNVIWSFDEIPVPDPAFTLASINMGESISFKFYVPLTAAQLLKTIRVDFDMDVEDGLDKTQSVALAAAVYDGGTDAYVFTYTGVTPQCIDDDVTAELYVDGVKVDTIVLSVADYLKSYTDIYHDADALIGALAVYGDAARTYVNYRAAETPIATVIGQSTATAAKPAEGMAKTQNPPTPAGTLKFAGTRLAYANVPTIIVKVNASDDGAYIKCGDVKVADVTAGVGEYRVKSLTALQIGSNYTFELYDSGDNLVQSLTYGVPACAYGWWDLGTNPNYTALVKALYTYGVEAAAYAS